MLRGDACLHEMVYACRGDALFGDAAAKMFVEVSGRCSVWRCLDEMVDARRKDIPCRFSPCRCLGEAVDAPYGVAETKALILRGDD